MLVTYHSQTPARAGICSSRSLQRIANSENIKKEDI